MEFIAVCNINILIFTTMINMNEGIHLDLDTLIVPGQIRKANLCRGLENRYTPAGTEVLNLI